MPRKNLQQLLDHTASEVGRRQAAQAAYQFIHERILEDRIREIDEFLATVKVKQLHPAVVISLLVATLPVAAQLPSRQDFGHRAARHIRKTHGKDAYTEVTHYI